MRCHFPRRQPIYWVEMRPMLSVAPDDYSGNKCRAQGNQSRPASSSSARTFAAGTPRLAPPYSGSKAASDAGECPPGQLGRGLGPGPPNRRALTVPDRCRRDVTADKAACDQYICLPTHRRAGSAWLRSIGRDGRVTLLPRPHPGKGRGSCSWAEVANLRR